MKFQWREQEMIIKFGGETCWKVAMWKTKMELGE